MNYYTYLDLIKNSFKPATKVEWLNPDETVNFEFTDSLYDISANVNVNYQDGSRRSCTVVLNNDRNKFPIGFNSIWIGQKFKVWMGIYINDTPYYFPQGVFYVSNPTEVYNPTTRTVTINGVDKWAWLDGTLNGVLSGTYQTAIGVDLRDATKALLQKNGMVKNMTHHASETDIKKYFTINDVGDIGFTLSASGEFSGKTDSDKSVDLIATELIAKYNGWVEFSYGGRFDSNTTACKYTISKNDLTIISMNSINQNKDKNIIINVEIDDIVTIKLECATKYTLCEAYASQFDIATCEPLDPISPLISNELYVLAKDDEEIESSSTEENSRTMECPYTATIERGKTYADVLLEYAKMLRANIYYDANGRLVMEPIIKDADDITDTDKEILWDFTIEEKNFLGLSQTANFDKVYNDFIVLGNIANGYQFKGRVQNKNPMSNTSVQRIGLKTKEPYEDNQYTSDRQCVELAKYYAKMDTILQKSGSISSTPLYHLDVNKLVTVSTPNNNMSKELFLISGYSLSSSNNMSISVVSVNVLDDFSVVEVEING